MPTYEYRCPQGHDFEHFVTRMSEAQSAMRCAACGEMAERRISAGGGLLFKGSGFYITDYGKDGKKDQRTKSEATANTAEKSASTEGGSAAPKETKSEAKPETKPAPSKPAPAAPPPKSES